MKKSKTTKLKVAITHDFLVEYGGAEKVLEAVLKIWPNAEVFTSDYWSEKFPAYYRKYKINTSLVALLPFKKALHDFYKIFHPLYFSSLTFSEFDIVISVSSGFSKWLMSTKAPHLAYINTPPRFLWGLESTRHSKFPKFIKFLLTPLEEMWRRDDKKSVSKANYVFGNSQEIVKRIKRIYGVTSEVLYPPVEPVIEKASSKFDSYKPYFLVMSRLAKYKRIDLAIDAFKQLNYNLLISGAGEELVALKKRAGKSRNIIFLGRASDKDKSSLYKNAQGFIFPGLEDFGITMVESILNNTPVVAYSKGGALEIVQDGINGVLFNKQDVKSIKGAVKRLVRSKIKSKIIAKSVSVFSQKTFERKMSKIVEQLIYDKANSSTKDVLAN